MTTKGMIIVCLLIAAFFAVLFYVGNQYLPRVHNQRGAFAVLHGDPGPKGGGPEIDRPMEDPCPQTAPECKPA